MDSMLQTYLDETEELMQKAEECLIKLDSAYSAADVNELFRIAHTIKGSSHMVGFEDIGNLMHKIEDMLDSARNNVITLDQNSVTLYFKGLDVTKSLLQAHLDPNSVDDRDLLLNNASEISKEIGEILGSVQKAPTHAAFEKVSTGPISSLVQKIPSGKNRYYMTFFIEQDIPMVSPVLTMIFETIRQIGTLIYSSISDKDFINQPQLRSFEVILATDHDRSEMYTYFSLFYVERINVIDLTRSRSAYQDADLNDSKKRQCLIILNAFQKLYRQVLNLQAGKTAENCGDKIDLLNQELEAALRDIGQNKEIAVFSKDFQLVHSLAREASERDDTTVLMQICRQQINSLMARAHEFTRGKRLFKICKPQKNAFIAGFKTFLEMMDRSSTLAVLLDTDDLTMLDENDLKSLIEVKRNLKRDKIELVIIGGLHTKRIVNLFDAIKPIEDFELFSTEIKAVTSLVENGQFCLD